MSLSIKDDRFHTLDDYYALPDDIRVELIDGVFYDMASPSQIHQEISGELSRIIGNYIVDKKGKCKRLYSPFDVKLFDSK